MRFGIIMYNKLIAVIVILGVLIIGGYFIYSSGPTVSAQGTSSIEAKPDKVSVYVTIETKEKTLQEAQQKNSVIREKVTDDLLLLGIDEDDIQYVNYNSYPWVEWSNGKSEEKGFIVYQQIVVKSDSFREVGKIVDVGVNAGAMISSIQFELSEEKQNDYKTEALELASKNARDKAASIAEGQGKKLGRLVSLKSVEFNYIPLRYYEASGATADVAEVKRAAANIEPQDLTVTASVQVEYKLRVI